MKLNPLQTQAIAKYLNLGPSLETKAALSPSWFARKLQSFSLSNAQLTDIMRILERDADSSHVLPTLKSQARYS